MTAYFSWIMAKLILGLLLCLALYPGHLSAWTYYANTGDVVQLHCMLTRSSICILYDGRTGTGDQPYNVVWVYSPLPPDNALSARTNPPNLPTTTSPPWVPDLPVNNPKLINSGGRFSIFPTNVPELNPEVILQITNVSWSDAGTYACYCAEEFPPRTVGLHQLVVFGRPYVIIASFETGYHYSIPQTRVISEKNSTTTIVTLAPYSNLTLTCVYSNTVFPIRKYVWLKDGADFSWSTTESTLEIYGMTREFRGNYACRVVLSEMLNATGPAFRLDTPEIVTSTQSASSANSGKREEFPIILVIVLACVLFVVILMTVVVILVVRALQRQNQERVRFTLPNTYTGYDSPRN